MDTEAPADAWYTWVGVAVVGVILLGFALGLPAHPPPDATKAANTIDRVAGSVQESAASYEHDATAVKIDTRRIAMRNDGGTTRASVAFGSLTPVSTVEDAAMRDALERITHGQPPGAVLGEFRFDSTALCAAAERTRERIDTNNTTWRVADGVLTVRQVDIDGESLVLVDA